MSSMPLIAVLITCFNRKITTLRCLKHLHQSIGINSKFLVRVYLLDDGSTDGTAEAVSLIYPATTVIKGYSSLYWCRGMHQAEAVAKFDTPDFFLWLNDDTDLLPNAIEDLLAVQEQVRHASKRESVVVGATLDPDDNSVSYSGLVSESTIRKFSFSRVPPSVNIQYCDTLNGNIVLIPKQVLHDIGGLDPIFEHALGDIDFGLRCKSARIPIAVGTAYSGYCARNAIIGTYSDTNLNAISRFKVFLGRKGLPPRSWMHFVKKHTSFLWPIYFLIPYANFWLRTLSKAAGGSR